MCKFLPFDSIIGMATLFLSVEETSVDNENAFHRTLYVSSTAPLSHQRDVDTVGSGYSSEWNKSPDQWRNMLQKKNKRF